MLSRAESDKKKAHADISMKLSKNVHEHEKFEYLSFANRNWHIFKMAVLKSKMAAAKMSDQEMKILHDTKHLKTSKMVLLNEIYHKIILVTLNQPYLII